MMRSWTAIAVAFAAIFAATGCNDYGNTFQSNTGAFIAFVSPSNVNACVPTSAVTCPDLNITLSSNGIGNGFVANTYVTWDQAKIKTIPQTDSAGNLLTNVIVGVVPAADLTKPGRHFIQTQSPYSGTGNNGLSNPLAFFVNPPPNPVPTITSISPVSAPSCGNSCANTSVALTINGSNFLPTSSTTGISQVNWNMGATQTTFTTAMPNTANLTITPSTIQLSIPGSLLATTGSAIVTVSNPPAPDNGCTVSCGGAGGGGTSPCPLVMGTTTGVTVCTFTITAAAGNGAAASSAQVEEETPAVSADGRYVAYTASESDHAQIFARDTCQGADSSCQPRTILISSALDGTAASEDSHSPSMSSDGRYVAFSSAATNLVAEPGTGRQVYLRDICFGASATCTPSTQLISTDSNGTLGGTESILPSISASGRFVAFLAVMQSHSAHASALSKSGATAASSGYRQVFVRDTCLGAENCTPKTTRISLQPGDGTGSTAKPAGPAISGGANHVALAGGNTATLFTHSVAVDDGVFLALTKNQR